MEERLDWENNLNQKEIKNMNGIAMVTALLSLQGKRLESRQSNMCPPVLTAALLIQPKGVKP